MKFSHILPILLAFLSQHGAAMHAFAEGKAESGTFDAKGVKIHYIVEGTGEPVVLIHGLYASAELNWNLPGIVAALAKDHQVIALDMPGHGQSDKPEDDAAYGRQMVEDVVLLMDHLKIPKAHIVGYSMGGMVAGRMMATHPDRIISCVMGGMGWMKEGSSLQKIWENMGGRKEGRKGRADVRAAGVHSWVCEIGHLGRATQGDQSAR